MIYAYTQCPLRHFVPPHTLAEWGGGGEFHIQIYIYEDVLYFM